MSTLPAPFAWGKPAPFAWGAPAGGAAAAAAPPKKAHATSGLLCFAGSASHGLTGRGEPSKTWDGVPETKLWRLHRIAGIEKLRFKKAISGPNACHYIAIAEDGSAYIWGRNESGQLGNGSLTNLYTPTKVAIAAAPGVKFVGGACGKGHTLLVTDGGEVWAAGENSVGQLGLGKSSAEPIRTWSRVPGVSNITAAAAGNEFSLLLSGYGASASADGKGEAKEADAAAAGGAGVAAAPAVVGTGFVLAAGTQKDGVCGSGTTGERIVQAGRMDYDSLTRFTRVIGLEKIVEICAGNEHAVARDSAGDVYSWGHGGYGRLGHSDVETQKLPKRIKLFEPERMKVSSMSCGGCITYFITAQTGMLYCCGVTKKTGEANTYPKPVQEMAGCKARSVASGSTSSIVAADEATLVSWGPSPTCGELAYGEAVKSNTKPKLVEDMEGCHVISVSMGMFATLAIVDVSSETTEGQAGKRLLAAAEAADAAGAGAGAGAAGKLPLYVPREPSAGAGKEALAVHAAGKAAKKGAAEPITYADDEEEDGEGGAGEGEEDSEVYSDDDDSEGGKKKKKGGSKKGGKTSGKKRARAGAGGAAAAGKKKSR